MRGEIHRKLQQFQDADLQNAQSEAPQPTDEGRAEGDDDTGEQIQAPRPGEAEEERRRDPDFGIVTFSEMRRHYDERARRTGIRALPEEAERRYWRC